MIEDLRKNGVHAKKIVDDMNRLYDAAQGSEEGMRIYDASIKSLMQQLKIVNDTIPSLLREISDRPTQKIDNFDASPKPVLSATKKHVEPLSYISPSTSEKRFVSIGKGDRANYIKELQVSEKGFQDLDKLNKVNKKEIVRGSSKLAGISNKFFRGFAEKVSPSFNELADDLRKANIHFLISTYLAIAFFVSALVLIGSSILFSIVLVFNLGLWVYAWIPFVLCGLTFFVFYVYPASERSSVQKKIFQELPFATIHMAAIAGADLEPTKIFNIIAASKEYPHVGKEIRKVINQVEIYGYDLVTALKNVAKNTSNKKLAELFGGLATNISTGGELKNYLEKKAENYLLDYKLEREKYSSIAGTFMDIYISILIAAPLILMMMFIVMNVSGIGLSLGIKSLMLISVGLVAVANVLFLVILHFKQPAI